LYPLEVPPEYSKYTADSPAHEAGFDSFLTAKVLIRLAARVEAETAGDTSPPSEDDIYVTAPEYGSVYPNDPTNRVINGTYMEQNLSRKTKETDCRWSKTQLTFQNFLIIIHTPCFSMRRSTSKPLPTPILRQDSRLTQ